MRGAERPKGENKVLWSGTGSLGRTIMRATGRGDVESGRRSRGEKETGDDVGEGRKDMKKPLNMRKNLTVRRRGATSL